MAARKPATLLVLAGLMFLWDRQAQVVTVTPDGAFLEIKVVFQQLSKVLISFSGCSNTTGSTFEVRQDVNVGINAPLIDAGWNSFTFSAYMQVYTQTPADQSQIIVEYRDITNLIVLASYNTGLVSNQGTWTLYSNTKVAPIGTRFIRIRLLGKVNTGPSVDAYFDNISLTTSIPLPVIISSFDVVPENTDVKLIWTTGTENDNNYFTVQRSQNGNDWTDLEKVQSISNGGSGATYTAL